MTDQHDPPAPTAEHGRCGAAVDCSLGLPLAADPAPPRLRTMTLPNGTWIFVLDRLSRHPVMPTIADDLSGFAEKTGAAATAMFAFAVDIEDAVLDEALHGSRKWDREGHR